MSSNDATSDDTDATVEEDFKRETNDAEEAAIHGAETQSDSDSPGGGFSYSLLKKSSEKTESKPVEDTKPVATSSPSRDDSPAQNSVSESTPQEESARHTPQPGKRRSKPKSRPVKKKVKKSTQRDFVLPPGAPAFDESGMDIEFDGQDLFCICRKPDDGKWMIGCDYCDEWLHGSCVGITPAAAKLMHKFCCPYCDKKASEMSDGEESQVPHQLVLRHGTKTTWKRTCRLKGCDKHVAFPSKYCSRDHGVEFMKSTVEALPDRAAVAVGPAETPFGVLSKPLLGALVTQNATLAAFKTLGSTEPVSVADTSAIPSSSQLNFVNCKLRYLTVVAKERAKVLSEQAATAAGVRKKDLCCYDARLDKPQHVWVEEYAAGDDYIGVLMGDPDTSQVPKSEYLLNSEHICSSEKRKCYNHLGWMALISDQLNLERTLLLQDAARQEEDQRDLKEIERLNRVEDVMWNKGLEKA